MAKEILRVIAVDNDGQYRIESNYSELDGAFDDVYVNFSGYFGKNNPHTFAAAPELLDALKEAADPICGYLYGPALDRARAAIAKATGK